MKKELSDWRLLDTGILSGAENMALDDAILECRAEMQTPNTLRFGLSIFATKEDMGKAIGALDHALSYLDTLA